MRRLTIIALAVLGGLTAAAETLVVEPLPGETWRGGTTFFGNEQPYVTTPARDLARNSYCNPCAPFFVSSAGRYVWSDRPFAFAFTNGTLRIEFGQGRPRVLTAGGTLREAYLAASARHFPPTGTLPDRLFFEKPQFNSWIESRLVGNGQAMVEDYVASIVSNGFPCGVFMLDDGWAPKGRYGDLAFNGKIFPRPKEMLAKIRALGMRTILWTTPYVSGRAEFHAVGAAQGLFLRDSLTGGVFPGTYWRTIPACGVLDVLDRGKWDVLAKRYRRFMSDYGFDGYKFDWTDASCLELRVPGVRCGSPLPEGLVPADYTESWGRFASAFRFNELRAGWRYGGLPLVCRLQDKNHSWEDLRLLVPDMLAAGMLGCAYACPDMIGGGNAGHFAKVQRENAVDAKLFVRSAQVQALMPMMQFSAAPWRLLKGEALDACRAAARLHVEFSPCILSLAEAASRTGEPIVRPMEYEFPHQGLDRCPQQFMLGDRWLVAPVVSEDDSVTVRLPKGEWADDLGIRHVGPETLRLENVPLARLPRFRRLPAD